MFRLALWAMLLTGCSSLSYEHRPQYHNPLAATRWDRLAPRPVPGGNASSGGAADAKSVRSLMVAQAEALMRTAEVRDGYGAEDVKRAMKSAGVKVDWRPAQGLAPLVDLARKRGAYLAAGRPRLGDIVLFHNQWDENANAEVDDWLTGAGVVVEAWGKRFNAVVRTGYAPRRVTVWPDGPAERMVDGEKVNDFLRVPTRSDPPDTPYLANQLYAGFIDVEKLGASR
jgi:hypothetical protein